MMAMAIRETVASQGPHTYAPASRVTSAKNCRMCTAQRLSAWSSGCVAAGRRAVGLLVVERVAHVLEARGQMRGELVGAPGRQDQAIHRLRVVIGGPGIGIQAVRWESWRGGQGAGGQR